MSKSSLKRLVVAAISLAVLAPSIAPAQAAGEIKIGVITSTSGPLASYGVAYNEGLTWGLNYYTGGKMAINGKKLVVTSKDDGADPASATASFKEMVGNGTKVIVGTASSGVALTLAPLAAQNKVLYISGPAKNDAVTSSANRYVFRSGNSSTQDLAPLAGIKPISGKKVVLFVEDNAFGAGNIAAAKALMGPKGAKFEEIKVPTSTSDFTPFAKKAADAAGSYIFIAWSNALTAGAMLTSLKVQGAFVKQRPITGLAGAATYNIYGTLFEGTNAILTNSYFAGASKSAAAGEVVVIKTLISHSMESGQRKDSDGNKIPRSIINRFTAEYNGKMVIDVELAPAISTNPYFEFEATVPEAGDFKFTWYDDDGSVYEDAKSVAIA